MTATGTRLCDKSMKLLASVCSRGSAAPAWKPSDADTLQSVWAHQDAHKPGKVSADHSILRFSNEGDGACSPLSLRLQRYTLMFLLHAACRLLRMPCGAGILGAQVASSGLLVEGYRLHGAQMRIVVTGKSRSIVGPSRRHGAFVKSVFICG